MKKKLVVYLPSFSDGGAEEVLINIANSLYREREIFFIVNYNFGPKKKKLDKNIKIFEIKSKNIISRILNIINLLKKIKPNCVFTTLTHSNILFCLINFISNFKFKLVIRETNIFKSEKYAFFEKIKMFFFQILKKIFYNQADFIIAINSFSKKQLICLGIKKKKILLANNPIVKDQGVILRNSKVKDKIILYLGRLTKHKNVDKIILDFNNILKSNDDYKLYIIGSGNTLKELKKLSDKLYLKNKIKFLGYIQDPIPYMMKANLLVCYSDYEGQPNSIIQASALGKNILIKKFDGILNIFKRKSNINIFTNFNDKKTQLFIKKSLVKKAKVKINKSILKAFSIKKNIKNYDKIFFEKK